MLKSAQVYNFRFLGIYVDCIVDLETNNLCWETLNIERKIIVDTNQCAPNASYNIYHENGMDCWIGHVWTGIERFYLFSETKVKYNIKFPWGMAMVDGCSGYWCYSSS